MAESYRRVDALMQMLREPEMASLTQMLSLPEDDRRAYYEKRIDWCNLLLKQVVEGKILSLSFSGLWTS